ncbi:putative disease resistance protein At1g61190 [Bidens hawaiensis]|uniref:putative disease resistance protein At1g61190 n=1 Tax=Bidens hawaiensis TaxID=980011 RepID=UPI004049F7E2
MEFVSPIVESLKKHLSFLVSSTEYVEGMKKKIDQLNHIEKDIRENRSPESHRKRKWLEDVKNLNERSSLIKSAGFFNVAKRYKLGKQSFGILQEIKDLENRESKIVFTHAQKPLGEVCSTSTWPSTSHSTQNNFQSRDLIFKDALKSLQPNNESQKMIALCGMGGVGKTTMMEQLNKAVQVSNMFYWVVKVVIGENPDIISLQQAISQYIDKDLIETNKDARADRLHEKFMEISQDGKKKILVIMDDLWKEVDLKDVGLTSPLPNGFKLLFTSRNENVCTQMGVRRDSIFRVGVLNGFEAKALFSRIVEPSHGDDPELQKIRDDIVMKCGGLPIAIITIAKFLCGNIKEAWEEALSNLQHHDLQDLDHIVHEVFEMSYNNLKKEDDKAIFLLCGLFPDDFNIPIEDLIRYGWGLNLFTKVHTLAQARRRTNICVNNLIRANLLIESDHMGCVKMHDLVRTFVLSNFSKVKQASIVNHDDMVVQRFTKDANESYERILLKCTGMSDFPVDFTNHENLLLLILKDGNMPLKFPHDLYEKAKNLEVISFENMGIPLLPIEFENSIKLRTLCFRSCSLMDDISFIGSLYNLETLSFANCDIRRLPSIIGELKKLKLLDLTGCIDLIIDDGVFQNLDSLEKLYMRAFEGRHVKFSHTNCDELEKLSQRLFTLELEFFENKPQLKNVNFKKLEKIRISIGCDLKCSEKYSFKNTLNIIAECSELQECSIEDLFNETEELQLQVNDMHHLEDVSMHHTFSQLRVLHVSKCANLTYLFTFTVVNGLKNLERLSISKCHVLKALVDDNSEVRVITLKKLKYMTLEDRPKLISLCDNVIELPEMVKLILHGLPNFTSIYPQGNNSTSTLQALLRKEVHTLS